MVSSLRLKLVATALAATVALGVAAALLGAENAAIRNAAKETGGFLSPREIDRMLADLDASPSSRGGVWGHVDYA